MNEIVNEIEIENLPPHQQYCHSLPHDTDRVVNYPRSRSLVGDKGTRNE